MTTISDTMTMILPVNFPHGPGISQVLCEAYQRDKVCTRRNQVETSVL